MIKKNFDILIIVFLSSIFVLSGKDLSLNTFKSIGGDAFMKHVSFLGSDLLEGRGTGRQGCELAAKYLALEMSNIGLEPAAANETYYQYVPMHGSNPGSNSELKLFYKGNENDLKLWDDYVLYQTGDQTYIPNPIEIVFAGYGIVAPEFDYNDYLSVDVDGKIVMILEGEPYSEDPEYFNGTTPSIYDYPETKQRIALARGAKGVVFIPNITSAGIIHWKSMVNSFSFENVTLAYSVSSRLALIINPIKADLFLKGSGYSVNDIYKMHTENRLKSFPLKTSLSFKGEFKRRDFVSSNIVGMIQGTDRRMRDEYLILSAHYDHLGIGPAILSDSIYNGVMDNAVGVAAILEIARFFMTNKPRRSIIFILTTGEEKGLLGARYYTDNPIVPLHKTIANINIDGLAFLDKIKSIIAIGSEYSSFDDFLIKAADLNNVNITQIPGEFVQTESFNFSDQMAFATAGIPSILIYEGADYENLSREEGLEELINYSRNIYHTPFDDLDQFMNLESTFQHIRIIATIAYLVANSNEKPKWIDGSPFVNERLRTIAEKR